MWGGLRTWSAGLALALALPAQEPPVLRVTTRLVEVSAVVQDKNGRPVAGLTREDFQLFDDGKEEKIRYFSVETIQAPAPAQALPAGLFSNRPARREEAPRSHTVLLLDSLNTRFEDQAYARDRIIRFLRQLQPTDRVAIYTLGSVLRVLHEFTSDTGSLLRALERYGGNRSRQLDATRSEEPELDSGDPFLRMLAQFMREANARMANDATAQRTDKSLQALEAIAHHLSGVPGRKNLIWVSGGFPLRIGTPVDRRGGNSESFRAEMDRAARAVNKANISIYPVDARGLLGAFDANPVLSPTGPPGRAPRRGMDTGPSTAILETHSVMRELADRTGGHAFYNTNDIQGAIRKALDDSRVTYLLAYSPSHGQWDGRFREIKVRVRQAGLLVRHRQGYPALPDTPTEEKQREAALNTAVFSPLEARGLGLAVRLSPAEKVAEPKAWLQVVILPEDLTFRQKDGRWVAGLDLLFVQRNTEGALLHTGKKVVSLNLTPENFQKLMEKGLFVDHELSLVPGAARVRVVGQDNSSGTLGSVDVPLPHASP